MTVHKRIQSFKYSRRNICVSINNYLNMLLDMFKVLKRNYKLLSWNYLTNSAIMSSHHLLSIFNLAYNLNQHITYSISRVIKFQNVTTTMLSLEKLNIHLALLKRVLKAVRTLSFQGNETFYNEEYTII